MADQGVIPGKHPIPQGAEVKITFNQDSIKLAHCILGARYVGAFDTTVAECNAALAALIAGTEWSTLAAFLTPTASIGGVSVRNLATVDSPYVIATGSGAPGTSTGTALPAEMAVCVTFNSHLTGARNRGRMYFPGWATNALGSGNIIAAAAVTALNTWAVTNIGAAMAALGFTHAIIQPPRKAYTGTGGASHPARDAATIDVVQRVVRDNHWDSQRRRGLK